MRSKPSSFINPTALFFRALRSPSRVFRLVVILLPTLAFGHGAVHERIAELEAALVSKPADAALHFTLADTYRHHGDWAATLRELAIVDQFAPAQFETNLLRGQALAAGGQLAPAKAALDALLATHPRHSPGLMARARVLSALGDREQAAADFGQAVQAAKAPDPDWFAELARLFELAGHREEALRALDEGVKKIGPVPALQLEAIELEVTAGHAEAAVARIDAMMKSAPRPEPWMAAKASALARCGRIQDSRAAWQGLIAHLAQLPPLERGSHAMSRLAEQAQQALSALSEARFHAVPLP